MPLFSIKAAYRCECVNTSQNMFALRGAKLRCRCHLEFHVNTKQVRKYRPKLVGVEHNLLETDQHNEKHAKQKI